MAEELKGRVLGGEGKTAEVDTGYFGGYVKPANLRERRRDRRFATNQSGKRKAVVIISRARRQFAPGRLPHRRASAQFHPLPDRQGRLSNGEQVRRVTGLSMKKAASPDFTGYWQRHLSTDAKDSAS
jgi:hypothetical protein